MVLLSETQLNSVIDHMALPKIDANPEQEKKSLTGNLKWRGYLLGLGLVVLSTLLGELVNTFFDATNIMLIYILCIAVSAILTDLATAIIVSILSTLAFDFFFVKPTFSFAPEDTQYLFTLVILLFVGATISYLTAMVRQQSRVAKLREQETAALYALGRDMAVSGDLASYIKAIVKRIKVTLGHDVIIFLPDAQNSGKLTAYAGGTDTAIDQNELAAAVRSFQSQRTAGNGTEAHPNTETRYLPLVTIRGTIGVMALRAPSTLSRLSAEQEQLVKTYVDLIAVTIEGIQMVNEINNAQVLKATEKLQSALLNAISHDLRTPLVSVIGTLSSLEEEGMELDDITKKNLIQGAHEEADRLNHLITNLLDESRLESGAITLYRQSSEIQDLVGAALEQMGSRAGARSIKVDIPLEMPFISVDFGLIVQTLVNILDNAMKYSPNDSPIKIEVRQLARTVYIEITDYGIGIPEEDLPHVFDKFYRIKRRDNAAGVGLGLSISKGIVEVHGGHIQAEKCPNGGTTIRIMLPVDHPVS